MHAIALLCYSIYSTVYTHLRVQSVRYYCFTLLSYASVAIIAIISAILAIVLFTIIHYYYYYHHNIISGVLALVGAYPRRRYRGPLRRPPHHRTAPAGALV
jgi:uncharacterized membrane protein